MIHQPILRESVLPQAGLPAKAALVILGSALVALGARAEVPMFPVPMTLQTLAISMIGLAYGARLAAVTVLAYLAQGLAGLPVFSGGGAGLAHLFGPTGGYLIGFVLMAWATGWMAEHGFGRGLARLFVAALIPALLLFVPGAGWLWAITPLDLQAAVAAGVTPFLLGALVKAAIAALVVAGGWAALSRR